MPAYIVATVTITDPPKFGEYIKGIAGLSERFGGETIARGPVSEVLEGEAVPGERIVVTRYPDVESARAYLASPEYQAAKAHRIGAGTVVIRLIAD